MLGVNFPTRVRSFERRSGRQTPGQLRAYQTIWPQFGLPNVPQPLNFTNTFGREAPRILEIGFGTGQSLLALAKDNPDKDYIGIETHKPGIGALLLGMQRLGLSNIRVYEADAVDVLADCIPPHSLQTVQIFFPDPWPKRRQSARRLIQPDFIQQLSKVLIPNGELHLATDWEDYAQHMLRVMQQDPAFINMANDQRFHVRSIQRPIITKFEQRAILAGRQIWDLAYRLTQKEEKSHA